MGWFNSRFAIALVTGALLAAGSACADDTEQDGTNQGVEQDAGIDADEADDVEDSTDTDDDPEADVDAGDPDQEEFDNAEPVECAHPSDDDPECPSGNFGPGSFFSEFIIDEHEEGEEPCCYDIDGDGEIDNRLGELIGNVSEIDGFQDINDNINTSIQAGDLTYLLEASHWDHPEWDQGLRLNVYEGGETGEGGIDAALDGDGEFRVSSRNFTDSGQPRYGFDHAEVRDGVMSAENGFITIQIPELVEGISADLEEVEFEGYVRQNPGPDLTSGGHFAIHDGKLGGVLMRDDFYKSLNETSYNCDCFEQEFEDPDNPDPWSEGVFVYSESNDWWICQGKAAQPEECTDEDNPLACQTLARDELCTILQGLSDETDIEIDGEKAYSLGVRFETVNTEIIGIDDD